ncbi:hypothetical protein CU048_01445 [Beijerinckiaceae bacterium]|nr:hypothetical protein CU048_01445 [Beijerinckiaceae bacterium]
MWAHVVWLARTLWACRVSVASAFGGLALFYVALPAQNLFADVSLNANLPLAIGYWFLVFAALFFFWAFPVHYGARRTLEKDAWLINWRLRREIPAEQREALTTKLRYEHAGLIKYVPRVLGLIPFMAFAVGIGFALRTQWIGRGLPIGEKTLEQLVILLATDIFVALLFWIFVVRRGKMTANMGPLWESLFVWGSLVATFLIFVVAYADPVLAVAWVPRALMIPFLFGSLVLILSFIQRRANSWGVPLLALALGAALILTGLNKHFNDLRTVAAVPQNLSNRQIDFKSAVDRWKAANDCADKTDCPPALIIAIDGGASRAAFAAATFVGEILDRMPAAHGRGRLDPARRIFAISGVSGGALGAAVIRAALADAMQDPKGTPPCHTAHSTWFRADEAQGKQRNFTWRECLQALVTGDYLSPVFIGLGFRDNFSLAREVIRGPSVIDDRAVLLEQAFERHYDYVVTENPRWRDTGRTCGKDRDTGLCRRFGYLPLLYAATGDDKSWLPLLFLNATSVQTGRRIIAADVPSTYLDKTGKPFGLYSQAYDLFEVMSSSCAAPDVKKQACPNRNTQAGGPQAELDAPDILLSTAALTSARFPIISPAGAFDVMDQPKFGDRLVDGGYFENSGDSTALDVAQALMAHSIQPVLLTIANDPEKPIKDVVIPRRPAVTPYLELSTNDFAARVFGVLKAPFETLLHTRDGHGAEAKDLADRTLAVHCDPAADPSCPEGTTSNFFKLSVAAQPDLRYESSADPRDLRECKDVWTEESVDTGQLSLSWWLAAAVQAAIDVQRCDKTNRQTLVDLMQRLSPPDNGAP